LIEFVNFKAYAHPLGGEIDITYDYSEKITEDCKVFIFKGRGTAPTDEQIYNILDTGTNTTNIEVWTIENYLQKCWDYEVEQGRNYFYKAIIERKTKQEDGSILTERSAIVSGEVNEITSTVIIHTIPMKKTVIEGMKKMIKAIVENINKQNPASHLADISVWDHFPIISEPTQFFTVTRANSDEGQRYWSNVFSENREQVIKGEIEAETINVTWMTVNNPIMRDQITNIMRGAKYWLLKYLRRQFETGVVGVSISMMADGDENPENQLHLFYSGMLIHFLVDTKLIINKPSQLLESISVELGFNVQQQN